MILRAVMALASRLRATVMTEQWTVGSHAGVRVVNSGSPYFRIVLRSTEAPSQTDPRQEDT
jgi:hypothetical protein